MILNNKNVQVYVLLLIYLSIWLISNNSFAYHRDEMWYTLYSIFPSDNTTNDIRHITQNDIHQIAFLPAFKYIHGIFVNMFGQNIYSLRTTNIFFASVSLFFTLKTMQKYKFSFVYLLLFILLISFDNEIIAYSHKARPDFSVSMLSLASIILILDFLKGKQVIKLFISATFVGLASSFYWNGLAALTAYGIIILFLLYHNEISFKTFLFLSLYSLLILILLLGIPVYQNFELFLETFTNDALIESPSNAHLLNIVFMFKGIIMSNKYGLLVSLSFFIIIYSISINLFNKRSNNKSNSSLLIFLTVTFLMLSVRSSDIRHIYMFLPLVYLTMFFSFNNINEILKINKFFLGFLICIVITLNVFNSFRYINKNYGQTGAYEQYKNEIESIVNDSNSLILMRYNMAWTIDNPKFYIANFNFKDFKNQAEFNELMKSYDLKYLLIDEPTRQRMNNPVLGKTWHKFLKVYIDDNFELKKTFYNKFYIKNKLYKYRYKEGYQNEIWAKSDEEY